jgi:hypothetical protein
LSAGPPGGSPDHGGSSGGDEDIEKKEKDGITSFLPGTGTDGVALEGTAGDL